MANQWYKLDTAAQLFPLITNKHDSSSFRIACVIKEDVEPQLLLEALKLALERFPLYKVRLRKGFFWYYLETNTNEPLVKSESPKFTESNKSTLQNDYLFNLTYFGKRIALEIFHGLTDGTGAVEFFKTILYHYLTLRGLSIVNNGEILTNEIEQLVDEDQDSFKFNYPKKIKKTEQEKKGFRIKGHYYKKHWIGCIQAAIDISSLKAVTHRYECTVSEYIAALLIYNIYHIYAKDDDSDYPIRLFVPVNARKYFNSKTLKNFVLFIRTNSSFEGEVTFNEVLQHVKSTFAEELPKEKMLARLKANVDLETHWLTRFIPLFIKQIVVRLVYRALGSDVNTLSFSNIGIVRVPKEMEQAIDRFEFSFGASKKLPIAVTAISIGNTLTLTFTTTIIERTFEHAVITQLVKDGVNLVVDTNELEVK